MTHKKKNRGTSEGQLTRNVALRDLKQNECFNKKLFLNKSL